MPRKPKFKPEITRVKLNPEQAVLACPCYVSGYRTGTSTNPGSIRVCRFLQGLRWWDNSNVANGGASS